MKDLIQLQFRQLADYGDGTVHSHALTVEHILYGFMIGLIFLGGVIIIMRRRFKKANEVAAGSIGNLQAEKAKSSLILNAIEDGVMVIDNQGIIRLCNPAAAKLAGWEANDTTGLDFTAVLKFNGLNKAPLPPEKDPISKAFKESTSERDSIILVAKDGTQIYISIVVSLLFDKDKKVTGAVAVFRDVSKEKSEEQRRADFISTASHEMRTPVAAIEGYLALALNDKVSSVDAKARSYLEKAHSSTEHLGKLFQDLLTSAKAEDGRLVSHPVVVEMGSYLEQIADSLRFAAQKKGLLTDFTIGASATEMNGKVIKPLYYVQADPDRLREVITNLFDNAVKYTESGKISIGLTGNEEVVQFFIKDTGPGIPETDLPHLFQKFYRVDNSATRTIGGTGLGLFICRKIVELYKGRIWVESQVGKGSTFYINLPRLTSQKADEMKQAEAAQQETVSPLDKS